MNEQNQKEKDKKLKICLRNCYFSATSSTCRNGGMGFNIKSAKRER